MQIYAIRSLSESSAQLLYEAAGQVFCLPPIEAMLRRDGGAIAEYLADWPADFPFRGPEIYFSPDGPGGLVITETSKRSIRVRENSVEIDFGGSVIAARQVLLNLPEGADVWVSTTEGIYYLRDRGDRELVFATLDAMRTAPDVAATVEWYPPCWPDRQPAGA